MTDVFNKTMDGVAQVEGIKKEMHDEIDKAFEHAPMFAVAFKSMVTKHVTILKKAPVLCLKCIEVTQSTYFHNRNLYMPRNMYVHSVGALFCHFLGKIPVDFAPGSNNNEIRMYIENAYIISTKMVRPDTANIVIGRTGSSGVAS